MLDPEYSLYLSNMNMLSPDGICHSFDDRANGYSRGEGVIVMILKKLSTAISDGTTYVLSFEAQDQIKTAEHQGSPNQVRCRKRTLSDIHTGLAILDSNRHAT